MRGSLSAFATVSGAVLALVGGLVAIAPDVPGWIIYVGGLALALVGFIGIARGVIRNGDSGRPPAPGWDDRERRPVE